ncbi:uncharacterized protein LOC126661967 [Mercurialis annua]|uniref:uncharacterized protein LOC126661967 n=1 Tax=Mercurialis annua TaxID=3986 RepID=UPI00215E3C67|nr:uncharacterized protein LOC126661967 [Mercurialis annua]
MAMMILRVVRDLFLVLTNQLKRISCPIQDAIRADASVCMEKQAASNPMIGFNPDNSIPSGSSSSAGRTPAGFQGFIESRRKFKQMDNKGNFCSNFTLPGCSDSSFSNAIIKHRSKINFAAASKEVETRKTWNIGLQLGLFSAEDEVAILELLCLRHQQDFSKGGLSLSRKQRFVRSLVFKNHLSVLGLIETKKESFDEFGIRRLWPNSDFNFSFSPSQGASGGLVLIWNKLLISPTRLITSSRLILVYASNCSRDRFILWQEINSEIVCDKLCILLGDFNEIMDPCERLNCSSFSNSMKDFTDFINSSSLLEVPLQVLSDWGPKPFKSINAWWNYSHFYSLVDSSWAIISENTAKGSLVAKLKELRSVIRIWNKTHFGDLNTKLGDVQKSINDMDSTADSWPLVDLELTQLSSLHVEFDKVSKQLDSLCLQKSRLNWNQFGERNTKYYHSVASIRSRSNLISEITVNNVLYSDPNDIKFQVFSFYKNLFKQKQLMPKFSLSDLPIVSLSDEQAVNLFSPFLESEIFSALSSFDDNKSPRPDEFNFFFYKRAWKILKEDILKIFSVFYSSGYFPVGLNTAFLVLLPMFKEASDIADFCPISLVNGIRKWVSKVLSERLPPILPSIISECQYGFVNGRNIHDCHMIASKIIHVIHSRREKALMIKLDFKKTFDLVSWIFIISMLKCMNFDGTWINRISSLFSSSQLSVLVNGSPSDNFFMEKGVRQGDPISPLLFVIAIEDLRAIFSEATSRGLIDGIQIEGCINQVSLLQFADDTLVFIPYDLEKLMNLRRILHCFELISGLEINFQKSSITGINIDDYSLSLAADILSCKMQDFSITYLGLPLSIKKLNMKQWDPVIHNFSTQLSSWRGSLLSSAGRLILIKLVLSSLPVYYMCSLFAPASVINCLEKYMRKFLWNGTIEGRYFSKVAWRNVCSPFVDDGLNTIPLRMKNRCLLFKWIWKIMTAPRNSMWFSVVSSSCGISFSFELELEDSLCLSPLWKGITTCCLSHTDSWNIFKYNVSVALGNGNGLRFWSDKWISDVVLSSSFPSLFRLSRNSNSTVQQIMGSRQSSQLHLNLNWNRSLRVGESEELLRLESMVESVNLISEQDKFVWLKKKVYSSASMGVLSWPVKRRIQLGVADSNFFRII